VSGQQILRWQTRTPHKTHRIPIEDYSSQTARRRECAAYGECRNKVESLIENSFLSKAGKKEYLRRFKDRLQAIS
jgi:hypothetical protein